MTSMSGGGGGGGAGGSLPTGVNQSWLESQGGSTNVWQPITAEMIAGALVNATSTGDTGGQSDQFPGTVLNAKWTKSANAVVTLKSSTASLSSSSGTSYVDTPFTPSGNFRIEARIGGGTSNGIAVFTTSGSDTGCILINNENNQLNLYGNNISTSEGVAPIFTSTGGGSNRLSAYIYVAIQRTGGSFSGYFSYDRINWVQIANFAEARSITTMGFRLGGTNSLACDFIDVVS